MRLLKLPVNLIHTKFKLNLIKYLHIAGKDSGGSKKEEEKKKDDEPMEKDKESKEEVKSGSAADAAAASATDAFEEIPHLYHLSGNFTRLHQVR